MPRKFVKFQEGSLEAITLSENWEHEIHDIRHDSFAPFLVQVLLNIDKKLGRIVEILEKKDGEKNIAQ